MTTRRWLAAVALGTMIVGPSQAQVLWNNGSFATGSVTRGDGVGGPGVAAPAGTQWSELADGNTSAGSAGYLSGAGPQFRIADDFTLTADSTLTSIMVYAYSTGSTPAQQFTSGTLQIWSGRPGDVGSTVVFGDETTNRLTNSTFSNIYRAFATTNTQGGTASAPGTTRPVKEITLDAAVSLPAGTYWVDYQVAPITGFTTDFFPYVTNADGVTRGPAGANARQLTAAGPVWSDVLDTGNPAALADIAQEFPFVVNGTAVPEPGSMALVGIAALGFGWRRWKKK